MVFDTPEDREFCAKNYGAVEGAQQTFNRLGEYLATVLEIVSTRLLAALVGASSFATVRGEPRVLLVPRLLAAGAAAALLGIAAHLAGVA